MVLGWQVNRQTNILPFMVLIKLISILCLSLVAAGVVFFVAARLGYFKGKPPSDLGISYGRLAAPSNTPNSVSSQTRLHPGHPQAAYAAVDPFTPAEGETGKAAFRRLVGLLAAQPGTVIIHDTDGYAQAEVTSEWLRFVDDVELWLDPATDLVHVRSASRVGRSDFGVNRARVDALRGAFRPRRGRTPQP
jgi:uncharacterized protein (DUF1499 family)